jgi:hypothetical protein
VLFLVLLLLLVLISLAFRRGRALRRGVPLLLPALFLLLAQLLGRRHRLRRLALPVLFLLAALLGVWRSRALRRAVLLFLAVLLLLATLLSARRRRPLWILDAFLVPLLLAAPLGVRRGRRLRRAVLLDLAELFPALQALRILLRIFQSLFHLLCGRQRLRDHGISVFCPALRILQHPHLLAHLHQRALEQRGYLVPPDARQLAQSTLGLDHHPLRGTRGDRLAEFRQPGHLSGPLRSKIDIQFRFRAPLAGQRHASIFRRQLDRVECVAGQAVCRDKRRASTDSRNPHNHRQHGGKHLVG